MFKRFLCCLVLIVAATAAAVAVQVELGGIRTARPVTLPATAAGQLTVALVPLDSRPPCTQYVEQLARLSGVRVLMPPPALLDQYRTPADRAGLRAWLRSAAREADAAIVSVDMLMHGGLLASRLNAGQAADADATVALLAEVARDNPRLKLYAFSIIPRLLLADSEDNARYQKKMLKYSILKDEVLTFENPLDRDKLQGLAGHLPPAIVSRYLGLYEANAQLNLRLMELAERGALAGLVVGQDDGYPFGMPNMVKSRLSSYVSHRPELAERVLITRGTDEVALTLLGRVVAQATGYRPLVAVRYSHADTPGMVMPYMPNSVARTVEEKIALVAGSVTDDVNRADFVLYVHVGSDRTGPMALAAAAREVKGLMAAGRRVGVVDLSEAFFAHDTLLPYLIKEGVDVTRLAAYAGWNTTSNSVGTAVTQAALYTGALGHPGDGAPPLSLYRHQLEFLTARMIDDWYYQKDIQPLVNARLKSQRIDPYNLADNFGRVDDWIRSLLADRAAVLYRQALAGRTVPVPEGGKPLVITGLSVESRLPWQRTFEVWVQPTLTFAELDEK